MKIHENDRVRSIDRGRILQVLRLHGVEIWNGCVVEHYTRTINIDQPDQKVIIGEKLIALDKFPTYQSTLEWLGY